MGSLERKIKRRKQKEEKKDMKQVLTMFNKLNDKCLTCDEDFDKNNKEHISTWRVVVREKEGKANLYCPECWDKAQDIIKEFTERQINGSDGRT
tara:strand:+ start:1140 stop:1421 length:282 start_codon:yes stop_codon:yes gene_type:complete